MRADLCATGVAVAVAVRCQPRGAVADRCSSRSQGIATGALHYLGQEAAEGAAVRAEVWRLAFPRADEAGALLRRAVVPSTRREPAKRSRDSCRRRAPRRRESAAAVRVSHRVRREARGAQRDEGRVGRRRGWGRVRLDPARREVRRVDVEDGRAGGPLPAEAVVRPREAPLARWSRRAPRSLVEERL